jgi:outer membrane biosynthesis protein TonB
MAGEATFSLSIRRSTLAGIIVSLLLHTLLIVAMWPHLKKLTEPDLPPSDRPISAQIRQPSRGEGPRPQDAQPPQPPQAAPEPAPRPPRETPRRRPPQQRPTAPPVITRRSPETPTAPPPTERPLPPLPPPLPQVPDNNPDTDMSAFMNKRQQQRQSQEEAANPGGNRGQSENEQAMERIRKNLARNVDTGAGGVFRIDSMGIRTALVVFNGWRGTRSRTVSESAEVDAGIGGDIELAVVRKIIELIRRDNSGDFQWQSYRLNREVTLSARPQDNAELERFLKTEFADVFARVRARR